jgi:hypothetical protein
MPNTADDSKSVGLLRDPKALLLELAGHHLLSELLPLAVRRLTSNPQVALARIWLKLPTPSEDCGKCRFASECTWLPAAVPQSTKAMGIGRDSMEISGGFQWA